MKRLLTLSLLFSFFSVFSAEEQQIALFVPKENLVVRNMQSPEGLLYGSEGFSVVHESGITPVRSYDVAPELRNMDLDKAAKLMSVSRLNVTRLSNGEYTIARHGELNGGGPIGAAIGFFGGLAAPYILKTAVVAGAGMAGTAVGGPAGGIVAVGATESVTSVPTAAAAKTSALYWSIKLGTFLPF